MFEETSEVFSSISHSSTASKEKGSFNPGNNSKELFLKLLNRNEKHPIPTLQELPATITLPTEIGNVLINNLIKTTRNNREHEDFISVKNGALKVSSYIGSKESASKLPIFIRSFGQNTATMFIHSHPNIFGKDIATESFPYGDDLRTFKNLNRLAFIFGITNTNDSTLLIQTRQSYEYSPVSFFSTQIGAHTLTKQATELAISIAKKIQKTHSLKDWNNLLSTPHRPEFFKKFNKSVVPILEKAGFGYYQHKGNIEKHVDQKIVFNRAV